MTDIEPSDKRDLSIFFVVLVGVMALGVIGAGIAAWRMFGQPRVESWDESEMPQDLGVAGERDIVFVLVDGLRADILVDEDRACPTLLALAAAGVSSADHVTSSTGTAAVLAALLVNAGTSNTALGLRSPRSIGFHRLPALIPTRAEAWRSSGLETRAIIGGAGLLGQRSGLSRGFDVWDAAESARDMRTVFERASALPASPKPRAVVLQFALGDEPEPVRVIALCRERITRFGDERAALETVLNKSLESDGETAKAIAKLFGRRRGQASWGVWRKVRYDALVAEFDERLRGFLGEFAVPPAVLVAGTRGRAVAEARPETSREGFSDALVRVPLIVRALGRDIELPRAATTVHSPALGESRSVDDLGVTLKSPLAISLRGSSLSVEVREVADPRNRVSLGGDASGDLPLRDPRAPLRVEFANWRPELLTEVGVSGGAGDSLIALGAAAWPWIADGRAPEWDVAGEPLLDVTRERSRWSVALSDAAPGPLVVHLASYPLERESAPLTLVGGRVVSGPLPGAAVLVLEPGQTASLKLENGKRLVLRGSHPGATAFRPADVRYLGRQLFGDTAQFLVPSWCPARPDWFVPDLIRDESRPSADFSRGLVLQRPDLGPALTGPLGLTPHDASALLALPSDA